MPFPAQIDECEELLDRAQQFVELCTYEPDSEDEEEEVYTTVGHCFTVMRKCREIANDMALKLEVWKEECEMPNYYMKLLFIVSRSPGTPNSLMKLFLIISGQVTTPDHCM